MAGVPAETVVELIINHLFDSPYPKVERKRKRDDASGSGTGVDKGKGKAVAVDEKKWRIDWMNVDRPIPSGSYSVLALVTFTHLIPLLPRLLIYPEYRINFVKTFDISRRHSKSATQLKQ